MTKLPREGRQGPAPKWPLLDDVMMTARLKVARAKLRDLQRLADDDGLTVRRRAKVDQEVAKQREAIAMLQEQIRHVRKLEVEVWREVWATPQAVMWERLGWTREVAQYVRWRIRGELGDLDAAKEARMWSDRLGLNPAAMRHLLWTIAGPAETETEDGSPTAPTGSGSRYGHLRVAGQ